MYDDCGEQFMGDQFQLLADDLGVAVAGDPSRSSRKLFTLLESPKFARLDEIVDAGAVVVLVVLR
jgi:hypothetical protein